MAKKRKKYQLNVFPSYKGGHTTLYGQYIFEFSPGHHLQNMWGFVAQHRLVVEDKIGRQLQDGEHVHHIDEVKTNNDPENLQVMSLSDHRKLHGKKMHEKAMAKLDKKDVLEALEGRTLKDAARILHVDVQTIRNRFPEVWKLRKRKTPVVVTEEMVKKILQYAADPNMTVKEASERLGLSMSLITKRRRRHGVEWVKVKRSKKNEYKSTYRGKPTLRSLIMSESIPELAGKEHLYHNKRLPKRLYQDLYQKYVQQA